jgi:hypothetical protein
VHCVQWQPSGVLALLVCRDGERKVPSRQSLRTRAALCLTAPAVGVFLCAWVGRRLGEVQTDVSAHQHVLLSGWCVAVQGGQLGAHVGLAPFALALPGTAAALMVSPRRRLEQPFNFCGWLGPQQ